MHVLGSVPGRCLTVCPPQWKFSPLNTVSDLSAQELGHVYHMLHVDVLDILNFQLLKDYCHRLIEPYIALDWGQIS